MFITTYHNRITRQLGHFPSLFAITTIAKTYRKPARGNLTLIGDGLAHFEYDSDGFLIWDQIDNLMLQFDLLVDQDMFHITSTPPEGYDYIKLFIPSRRNDIMTILRLNPTLQQPLNFTLSPHSIIRTTIGEEHKQ